MRQLNPFFDSAGARSVAIVVDDALAPRAPKRRIFAAREDDGILDGNNALVVIAVERPGLKLAVGQLAFVHHQMERMPVMVSLGADCLQPAFKLSGRQQFLFLHFNQSVISIPSQATSQPESLTVRRSVLSSSRIGFVLLM